MLVSVALLIATAVGLKLDLPWIVGSLSGVVLGLAIAVRFLRVRSARLAFAGAVISALLFIGLGNAWLVPAISAQRSTQLAVVKLSSEDGHFDLPIVYYGRPPRSMSISMPGKPFVFFNDDSRSEAIAFFREHPRSMVVVSEEDADQLMSDLGFEIVFVNNALHRKLFTTRQASPEERRNAISTE